jgi:hypothetical protein
MFHCTKCASDFNIDKMDKCLICNSSVKKDTFNHIYIEDLPDRNGIVITRTWNPINKHCTVHKILEHK